MAGLNLEHKVRTNRLLTIDRIIREGKYPNTDRLAELVEVTPRTIQRDLEYMRDMYGAPIEYSPARHGFYYSEPNFFIKSVPLTEGELFSIALFDQLLDQYRNTPLEKDLRNTFGKIVQSLPDTVNVDANFLTEQMTFIPDHAGTIDREAFRTVFTALKLKRSIQFEYRSLEQSGYASRMADPYHAVCQRGNWYFIGFCHERREPRLFSFSRMKKVKLAKQVFVIPEDFNPQAYFDKEMGVWASSRTPYTVELLFDREISAYALDRQWHSTQTALQREDGSVYVKFTTTQMPEVLRWVLGQGHTVKALGPAELVEMVKAEAEKVRGMY
ncbi:MAG: YafY family transcriptional regulator [Treponema sp.]|jgi:predicted DNA-binding transcriptional regulator YafY|nr:YafY family transcriptional regulator [Treponema sp.]